MKQWLQRFAVMSAALVLLCVSAFSQKENEAKSVTNDSYGVTLSRDNVILLPGHETTVEVTVKPGYKNPFLIHYGETIEMSETIRGDFFTARIISQTSSRMIIHIKADDIVNRIDSDAIYVRAVLANVDYGMTRSTAEPLGATIVITVYPN